MGTVCLRRSWGFRSTCAELSRPLPPRYSHTCPLQRWVSVFVCIRLPEPRADPSPEKSFDVFGRLLEDWPIFSFVNTNLLFNS